MGEEGKMVCFQCDLELVEAELNFTYLGHAFHAEAPRCPGCGQVFLSDALVKGRVAEVETELEDK